MFMQKIQGSLSLLCTFLTLKMKDNPIWYGTLCIYEVDKNNYQVGPRLGLV